MNISQYILIRSSQPENQYGSFVMELLKYEGFNSFIVVDLTDEPIPELHKNDLLVLSRCFLRDKEIEAIHQAVANGTGLVCIQPQARLAKRFDWKDNCRAEYAGWVQIKNSWVTNNQPVQTHVPICSYQPDEDESLDFFTLADTVNSKWEKCNYPAAIQQKVGKGIAVFFFYDLAKAVVRLRFGDPELASIHNSKHWHWQHAADLFAEQFDSRSRFTPQADLHCQLFARAVTAVSLYPLLRLWYYEKAEYKAAAVFTSDGDRSTPDQFEELSACLLENDATASFYLMKGTKLSQNVVSEYRAKGHTFAAHIDPNNSEDEWYFDFPRVIKEETDSFKEHFGELCPSLQCHWAPWQGYMNWLADFIDNGYRMLMAYMSLLPDCIQVNNYMCGSTRPMKFVTTDGKVRDCWQQPISILDDGSIREMVENNLEGLRGEFDKLLNNAMNEHHCSFGFLSHPCSFANYSRPYIEYCLKQMKQKNIPVYNGTEWCRINDERYGIQASCEIVSQKQINYTLSHLPSGGFSLMLPKGKDVRRVSVNAKVVEVVTHNRLGMEYLFVDVAKSKEAVLDIEVILN